MIRSFRCRDTEAIFLRKGSRRFRAIENATYQRLVALDGARNLADLAAIRSNYLEALKRERKGQYSIRINEQWRICFLWDSRGADAVESVDCHD